MGTPAWQRLVRVILSGIVVYGAGAVAPTPSVAARIGDVDDSGAVAISETPDLAPQTSGEAEVEAGAETGERVEILDERSLDSRTFRNADGTFTTELHGAAIHYEDAAGALKPIDTTPVPSRVAGVAFETKAAATRTSLGNSSARDALISVSNGDYRVSFRPATPALLVGIGVAADRTPVVEDGRVYYRDVYPDVDLRYALFPHGVKEDIILKAPSAPTTFAYVLDAPRLKPVLLKDGSIELRDGDKPIFQLPAPFMVDSAPEEDGDGVRSTDVAYELLSVGAVTLLVIEADKEWLADPKRVYPVYVDPTINDFTTQADTFISSAYPNNSFNAQWNPNEGGYYELWNGKWDNTSGINYAFIKTGHLANVTVLDADFHVYIQHAASGGTATQLNIAKLTSAFSTSQTWNQTHPSFTHLTHVNVGDNTWANYDVDATVQAWASGTATNYGFRISPGSSTLQSQWKRLRASENYPTNDPYLTINWTRPVAAAVGPSGAAWTNSSLLDWTYSANGSSYGQAKYHVQVSTDPAVWTGTPLKASSGDVSSSATSWAAPTTNLVNGTTYYWRVKAFDGYSWSAWTSAASFKWDAAAPTPPPSPQPLVTIAGAITPPDPAPASTVSFYEVGNGTFTVKIRGTDTHSGIKLTQLRLTSSDGLTAYHDWSGTATNCTVSDPSTLVNVTACSRTYNSSGTREVQFTVVGLNQNASFDIHYYFSDYAGNTVGYTDTGKNLIFDATPPMGTITSPAAGSTVSGSVPIVGTASDANFKEYQLHYESAAAPGVWNPIGTNPYPTAVTNGTLGTWDAAALANGNYTLRLRVYDKARVSSGFAEVLRPVTLANGAPLTAEVTSPLESSVVEGLVPISGTASATYDFDRYELHYGASCDPASWADLGVNPRTAAVTDGVLGEWDTTGLTGDHAIRLTAYQVGGATAQASVCIHVGPRLPEVSLTSPAESAALFSTEQVTVDATHENGVTTVEIVVDGLVVGSDMTAPFEIDWDTTSVSDGAHEIVARATATSGEVGTSEPIAVDVANALAMSERVEADYEAGRLTVDEYVLAGVYAHGSPDELDPRYSAGTDVVGDMASATEYASKWDELTQATRDEVNAFLAQPMRGWLYGAVEETGGSPSGTLTSLDAPNVSDPCVRKVSGLDGATFGWHCKHESEHFEIHYTLGGTSGAAERDSISELPDDVGADALGDTANGCASWWAPGRCNGVPDQVDQIAQGLEDAYDVYTDPNGMGFSGAWSGRTVVVIRGGLDGGQVWPNLLTCLSLLEDTETIEIGKNSGAPYYLAHHELFHVFQHDYIACGSWGTSALLGVGPWWWVEATAEWAAGQVSRSGNFGNSGAYANKISRFFATPDARLDTFERPDLSDPPHRQYGAFVFAEHLAEHVATGGELPAYNMTIVRETWEEIGSMATPQRPVEAIDAVLGDDGMSLTQVLSDFSKANYLLDYEAPDLEPEWRFRLENDNPLTAADGLGPARPARDRYDIIDGQRVEGTRTISYGAAAYIEIAPPLTEGTVLVDVSGATGAELHARVVALDYHAPPQAPLICDDQVISLGPTGGVAAVDVAGGCRYAVLILTGLVDGEPSPIDWGAQFIEAPTQSSCVESFSRSVSPGGWGLSEFGVPWVNWTLGPDDPQASVDGSVARILGASPSRLAAEGLALEFPVEVIARWRFVGPGTSAENYFELHLQHYDSGRDVSASYHREFLGPTDISDTIANHEGSQAFIDASTAAPDGQWMWMRVQVTDTQTRMSVWADGETEPATWQQTATGPALPAAPDVVTVFAIATNADQGVEVDSISVVDGCQYMAWTDPFDRTVQAQTGVGAGWGTGPMGEWELVAGSTAGTWEVNDGIASHTSAEASLAYAGLDAQQLLGPDPRSELEVLVKWRVDSVPADNSWSFEAYLTDVAGLSSEYAGVGLAGFGADEAFINAGFTYAPWSDFYNAAPGYPRPMHDKDMWIRLLVDEHGVYARVWEDGQPEPVDTGGVAPPYGGRGERWHTYEVNDDGLPPMVWRYITLRMSGGADVTSVDSVGLTAP